MPQTILEPNFLKVSSYPTKGTLRVVPYRACPELAFTGPNGEDIRLRPQLYGQFLVLGVNQKISPRVARVVLEYLRGDMPRFYRLGAFLLREVPEGSSEETIRQIIMHPSPDRVELSGFKWAHTVRILEGGHAECSCPDYTQRRAGTGTWCKHIKFVHQALRERFSPNEDYPYHLPLWSMSNSSNWARLIESLGGLYKLLAKERASQSHYSHSRGKYKDPMLGVEFEIPRGTGEEFSLLRRVISALISNGLIQSYEYDESVEGGEIKLTPFPATLEEVLKKGQLLKDLRDLVKGLFVSSLRAGMHVHINMYPFRSFTVSSARESLSPERYIREKISPIVSLFEKRFNLAVLFGRGFNRYALKKKDARGKRERYGWANYKPLPYTVEIRLGCAKKGDPVKILLITLFMQRAFWAIMEGRFVPPSIDASREEVLSAFASVLSEEERNHIVPLLESALIDRPT